MSATVTNPDTLPHIAYQNDALDPKDPKSLRNRVSSPGGSIVAFSAFGCSIVINYAVNSDNVDISVVLQTPLGSVTLGSVTLDPSNPTVTLGGSIGSFKAEVTVSFNFQTMVLSVSAQICAPILGCKSGSFSIKL